MIVFITGATSGIGAALARHYAAAGATLGLTGRRVGELQRLRAELGVSCSVYSADVTDVEVMKRVAASFMSTHGIPDVVIANAGISIGTLGSEEAGIRVLDRVVRTNVVGLAATLSPFAPAMIAEKRGVLVGVVSVAAFRGLPGAGAYSASKAAAMVWLESLRVELRGSGVSVTILCPGFIDTPMTRVNDYRMPFMLSADEFARRASLIIARRKRRAVIPWPMAIVAWGLRHLPDGLYDRLLVRLPRKRRDLLAGQGVAPPPRP